MTQTVDYARAVEIESRRLLVLERIEAGPLTERLGGVLVRVAPDGLEERVAGGDPFNLGLLGSLAVR